MGPRPRRGLGLPEALRNDRKARERLEQARLALRAEEVLPEAGSCPDCAAERERNADPTYLCRAHLAAVAGL